MEKLLEKELKISDIVFIISKYVYNPIDNNVHNQIINHEQKEYSCCITCGNFNDACKCNDYYQSQYELRMRRINQYCFGCPGANLPQSDFEQDCPICGLTTY